MTGPDFDHFCRLVQARSGIVLSPDKAYLVQSRLEPVARAEKLNAFVGEILEVAREGQRRAVDAFFANNIVQPGLARDQFHRQIFFK